MGTEADEARRARRVWSDDGVAGHKYNAWFSNFNGRGFSIHIKHPVGLVVAVSEHELIGGAVGRVGRGPWKGCHVVVLTYWSNAGPPTAWEFRFSDIDVRGAAERPESYETLKDSYDDALRFVDSLDVAWYPPGDASRLRQDVFRLQDIASRIARWLRAPFRKRRG